MSTSWFSGRFSVILEFASRCWRVRRWLDWSTARLFYGQAVLRAHSSISASKDAHPEGLDLWALDMFRGMRRVYSGVRSCLWFSARNPGPDGCATCPASSLSTDCPSYFLCRGSLWHDGNMPDASAVLRVPQEGEEGLYLAQKWSSREGGLGDESCMSPTLA